MSDQELLALSNEILKRVESGEHDVLLVQMQMLRLISHVRSEQRTASFMSNEMKTLNDAMFGSKSEPDKVPGMVNSLREVKESMAVNRKIHMAVATGIGSLLLKSLYDILIHVKP